MKHGFVKMPNNAQSDSEIADNDNKIKIININDGNKDNEDIDTIKRLIAGTFLVIVFFSIGLIIFIFIHVFIFVRLLHIELPLLEFIDIIILIPLFFVSMLEGFNVTKKRK